jgi:hypothetical protein
VAALPVYQQIVNILNFSGRSSCPVEFFSRVGSSFGLLHRLNPVASFVDVEALSLRERRQLVLTALGSNVQLSDCEQLDGSVQLLYLVIDAWSRAERVSRAHVYAILLCRYVHQCWGAGAALFSRNRSRNAMRLFILKVSF